MRLKSIIRATLALAAASACGVVVAQETETPTQELPTAPALPQPQAETPAPGPVAAPSSPRSSEGEFVVGDIRIEGLQRISEGTVYNYLPINIGDRLDQRRVAEALRALYDTKFFKDVELRRDG